MISSQWSLETASYWIEAPEGLVLFDTQLVPSAIRKEVTFAERESGKRAKAALVLHANPDRFDGTGYLEERGIPVLTTEEIRAEIPAVHAKWASALFAKYQPSQYQRTLKEPRAIGSGVSELELAGARLVLHRLGAGCSPHHLVVEWEGHLFVGDLVSNGAHSWFEDGRLDEWLRRLEELRALKPRWIHPGRGMTGGPELLDAQRAYLEAVRAAVAAEQPRGLATAEVMARIRARVPPRAHPELLEPLLKAEWARQAAAAVASPELHGGLAPAGGTGSPENVDGRQLRATEQSP